MAIKKYFTPKNYINYFYQLLRESASFIFAPLESWLSQRYGEQGINCHPPILIIGAPRCGSTLLYKVLTDRYYLNFISNFTAAFYRIPVCATWIARKMGIKAPSGGYTFNYGYVEGLGSPNESAEFWYRWFPRGLRVYVPPKSTELKKLTELRHEIGAMSDIGGSSMIFKNLYNSMRLAPIIEAIPEASFIICKRDFTANALSILEGRIINVKDKNTWWSVPPKEIENLLKKDFAQQVVGQVYYIMKQIREDLQQFGDGRFLEVQYEEFCTDVDGTLKKIKNFLERRGVVLKEKNDVPTSFEIMNDVAGVDLYDCLKVEQAAALQFKGIVGAQLHFPKAMVA